MFLGMQYGDMRFWGKNFLHRSSWVNGKNVKQARAGQYDLYHSAVEWLVVIGQEVIFG